MLSLSIPGPSPFLFTNLKTESYRLNCNIGDVMEFVPDNENGGKDA